jgi:membrane protease YdiL (CAAX protease family)
MDKLKNAISNHPVVTYFALTFAISWGGVLLVIGGWSGMAASAPTGDARFVYAVLAMLAGPTISSMLLTIILEGRNGVRALRLRLLTWRVSARWYATALLTAPLLWLMTIFLLSRTSLNVQPGIVTATDKAGLVLVAVAVALGAGVFEELGWTGFAIPRLRRRHGPFSTAVIVGVLWGAWHLLTNVLWASRVSAGELTLPVFLPASILGVLVGYLLAFRVLMVWVYERTGSLLIAMLMHMSLTASVLILDPAGLTGVRLLAYSFALAAAAWSAVAVLVASTGWHLDHRANAERVSWALIGLFTVFWLGLGIALAVNESLGWTNWLVHLLLPGGCFALIGAIAWRWRAAGAVAFIALGAVVAIVYPAIYLEFFPAATVMFVIGTVAAPAVIAGTLILAASRNQRRIT